MPENIPSENPYSSPLTRDIPRTPSEEQQDLATRGERLGGNLIDSLVSGAVALAAVILSSYLPEGSLPFFTTDGTDSITTFLARSAMGIIGFIAVQTPLLLRSGQTIGKRTMGTAIVDLDGNKPPLSTLLLKRYGFVFLVGMIPIAAPFLLLVDSLLIFGKQKRCLHDYVAGTKVISLSRKAGEQPEEPPAPARDSERDSRIFDELLHHKLDLKPSSFPANADFMTELRIPRSELLSLYSDLEDRIFIEDIAALERCRTYAEVRKALDLS